MTKPLEVDILECTALSAALNLCGLMKSDLS